MTYEAITESLAEHGLLLRGGFHPDPEDGVPGLADGRPAAALLMVGNAGPGMWQAFSAAPEAHDGGRDPLDRWSRRVIGGLAQELGGAAHFPSDGPPYRPFAGWAVRADAVAESPLGILIHPDFGLWHAYRGAIALAEAVALPARDARPRPCDGCAGQPCLAACPVAAFGPAGYDVPACVGQISGTEGSDCLELGCRARRACPVGRDQLYDPAQAEFHMAAFLAARREAVGER